MSWRDRRLALRDRLLSSPRFQRWAAAFPLTRRVARRHVRDLFDLCAGFVYAQVLLACVRLRLFEVLAESPLSIAMLAARLALPPESARRLVLAAESLRLVERRDGDLYGLGARGAALVGNPALAAMIEHHALFYADLQDPVALLRGGGRTALSGYWPYAGTDAAAALTAEQVAPYSALMAASQAFIADEVLDAYDVARHRCLLDIGGGEGAFLCAAGARAPALRLMLLDLPPVAARARARFAAAGLGPRAIAVEGDFRSDSIPSGADLVSLIRVVHDHEDATVLRLFRAIRSVLPPQGTLLVAEPMAGTPGAEPIAAAYFGFYLLAMGSGRPRTPAEIERLLREAGFSRVALRPTRTPLLVRVILAKP